MQKIILASQSPRRKQLLEWAEVPFEIIVKEKLNFGVKWAFNQKMTHLFNKLNQLCGVV